MHEGDRAVDEGTARALLRAQFPQWADLPLERVMGGGSDNVLLRLGPDMVLRFPRTAWGAGMPGKEDRWLPILAPHLPLPLPVPLALGQAGAGYPFPWSVTLWLPGRDAGAAPPDQPPAAQDLAGFLSALHALPLPPDAPRRAEDAAWPREDAFARQMIAQFRPDEGEPRRLSAMLDAALALPAWDGRAV